MLTQPLLEVRLSTWLHTKLNWARPINLTHLNASGLYSKIALQNCLKLDRQQVHWNRLRLGLPQQESHTSIPWHMYTKTIFWRTHNNCEIHHTIMYLHCTEQKHSMQKQTPSSLLDKDGLNYFQVVIGALLHYSCPVDTVNFYYNETTASTGVLNKNFR